MRSGAHFVSPIVWPYWSHAATPTATAVKAEPEEVASSVALTVALGIFVALLLPLVFTLSGMTEWQYGILVGLTVYAVPQVLAATMLVGILSTQIGTLVKLTRVPMLGPVILLLSIMNRGRDTSRPSFTHMVPWFILGFLIMMTARSFDILPQPILGPIKEAVGFLTTVAIAAFGLSADLRTALSSGGRVLAAGTLSTLMLALLSATALTLLPAP